MKVEYAVGFLAQLESQCRYIARDKPAAAKKFKKDVLRSVRELVKSPFSNRKSKYFEEEDFRDLIFKGYKITYHIDRDRNVILVIGLVNMQRGLSEG